MEDKNFDSNLQETMKKSAQKIRPTMSFRMKMRWRLFKKGLNMHFMGTGARMKFASAGLVVFLTMGGGVGTYAYTSPDVNVMHPLFGMKQGIESIEEGFNFSPEQKANFHMKKALRRMDEAEILHKKFAKNHDLEREAAAIERTLEFMEMEMDNSFTAAAKEFDIDKAERVLENFEGKFGKMKERIGKLPQVENGRPYIKKVHERVMKVRDHARQKIERLGDVRGKVMDARRAHMKRVMFGEMMGTGSLGEPVMEQPVRAQMEGMMRQAGQTFVNE